ncbi:MAG: uroporphyrinogen-III synthase [Legionellaceae bacterium]
MSHLITMLNLNGLRLLNTRPTEQAHELSLKIEKAGGSVIECPALHIQPLSLSDPLDIAVFTHAIFISPHAVSYFFKAYPLLHWPSCIQTFTLGRGTQKKLDTYGITTSRYPTEANSEALLKLSGLQKLQDQQVLLVKGEGGRPLIEQTLRERGAIVFQLNVYRRICPPASPLLHSLWQENAVDIILITSYDAMLNLMALFGDKARNWLLSKPWLVISERLALLAKEQGATKVHITRVDTILETLNNLKEMVHATGRRQDSK